MSQDDIIGEDQIRRLRAQLPDFTKVRDTAVTAVAAAAKDIDLDISTVHARSLALAVVDGIEQGLLARGADWAYGIVERETDATDRQLVMPAKVRAAADPDYAGVLRMHEQYLSGMTAARRWLRTSLITLAGQAVGKAKLADGARDLAMSAGPQGDGQRAQRSTVRAGLA